MVNGGSNKKMEVKNKKAIFFTIIAIVLISLFIASFSLFYVMKDRSSVNKRVDTMNNFIFSLNQDISRQGYISGYRALLSLQDYISSSGEYLDNAEESVREATVNGTVNGQISNLMEGYTLPELNIRISDFAKKMNLDATYTLKNVSIKQEDPWNIIIEIEIELYFEDKSQIASWNKTEKIISKIEIIDFEDPLYVINTNGFIANKIKMVDNFTFVEGTNVSNLLRHVNKSAYIASELAPSFLDRLEGKLSPNPNGIESLVYLPDLSAQGLTIKEKSVVDYIYFSDQNPTSFRISGMPDWFRLDDEHLEKYGAGSLSI
jgi:hypothetical protein